MNRPGHRQEIPPPSAALKGIFDMTGWNERYSARDPSQPREASALLKSLLPLLPTGRALDLACGEGRNALYLAEKGYSVDAIDSSLVAIERNRKFAEERQLKINYIHEDLETISLPPDTYDLILNFYYLQRPLVPSIESALKKGGVVLFETYTTEQREIGPQRNPDYLLGPNELLAMFKNLHLFFYREGIFDEDGRKAIASLAAKRVA